jgi:hypothetical protein
MLTSPVVFSANSGSESVFPFLHTHTHTRMLSAEQCAGLATGQHQLLAVRSGQEVQEIACV